MAGQAAECANEQGQFWPYHDQIFVTAQAGELSKEVLKGLADELELDSQAFNSCLDSGRYAQKVTDDTNEGRARGVKATPTFFINGRKVEGNLPFEQFKAIIEEELSKGS